MEPTDLQLRQFAWLRKVFGGDNVKPRAPVAPSGNVRVELKCAIGKWHWTYNTDGVCVSCELEQRLFHMDPHVEPPRNAIDS